MSATTATTEQSRLTISELSARHIRLGLMIGLAILATLMMAGYFVLALEWRSQPFLGATVNHTMTINASVPNSGETWPGKQAGLRIGDQIVNINGQTVNNSLQSFTEGQPYNVILRNLRTGDPVEVGFVYDVARFPTPRADGITCAEPDANGFAACQIAYTLSTFPDADFIAFFVVPYITGIIVLFTAISLITLRPLAENTFIAICILIPLALAMGGIFDVGTSHRFITLWFGSTIFTGIGLITMGLIFPRPLPIIRRQPLLRFIPALVGVSLVIYTVNAYGTDAPAPLPTANQVTVVVAMVGLGIMTALTGFYHRRVASNRIHRDQANVLMLGALLGLSPSIFWITGRIFPSESALLLSIETSLPFLITLALSLAYVVLQSKRLDTEALLNQSLTYFILLIALGIGYAFLVLGATLFATDIIRADNPLLIVLTIFIVSLLFVPVRTNLQRRIDRIYYRTRHDYQSYLEDFSRKLTSLAGSSVMIPEFRNLLDETIKPINTLIFLRNPQSGDYIAYGDPVPETDVTFSASSGIVRLLRNSDDAIYLEPGQPWPPELHIDKARLGIIKVQVIAGMAGETVLNGFVAIGPPKSGGEGYNYEELRFVRNLVGQLSIAIERATVIDSLERSVKELEVLSQVSQAVNFTVDTEDLLELLSAQTLRLMGSPYFYIVLRDPVTYQLYYAFFQEEGERRNDIENQKWAFGNDLYSEVVRSGQPMRVENYVVMMERRGYRLHHESNQTRAWLAVPLTAGAEVLGAMIVAEKKADALYSNDQLRTMSDIGALAASALDKSRLFSEANRRARQLAVLNDISRQLVATEGDVERLLDLITSSAVEILNAEAGSLLLTVEDGSGDLEFRVATGDTGQTLIGKRLKKGHGLVGRVASDGKPIISNDTTHDEDWQGEISEGFRTQSILAVPLIAQDQVIGVLEVINKLDGSIYVEDDVELLTTFAGQAAIAFENARLFQQTDLQLSQRVRELEALERIDRELNRNLDLYNVAEITVRWAILNSNARSGLLGVPDADMQYLTIVAKQGYGDDDVPEGADGNRWPMNRGIVSRVLRTRRPDLQPYVHMDPDYVPSLRQSLSQITVPMMAGDEIGAILIIETDTEPRLNLLDQDWVQRLAEHASIAIENAKLYDELTRANKSKSEFMGFAAHELKTPLTAIKGWAGVMTSSMASVLNLEQIQQYATTILNNSERMQGIIDDLRDIAKDDAGMLTINAEPTNIRQIILDTLITLQKAIDSKNQTVINNVNENLPLILGDAQRLTQVMLNFVSNAHKYSPEDATIIIDAEMMPRYISRRGEKMGDMLRVAIRDNGMGMSQQDLEQLFRENYFRSENREAHKQEGTGLGMIITKRLIEGHNGEVWVESELGKGSTFYFVIPVAPEEVKTEEADSETVKPEASD